MYRRGDGYLVVNRFGAKTRVRVVEPEREGLFSVVKNCFHYRVEWRK